MDRKKNEILEFSASAFLEKGFHSTSIQDIAAGCNMSKATIYKYFESKEEIGFQVVLYVSGQILYQIKNASEIQKLSARELLQKGIYLWVDQFLNKTNFVDALIYSFSTQQKERYIPLIQRARFRLFLAFVDMIRHAYELRSEAAAWELALNLNGLIREITYLEMGGENFPDRALAVDFILDSLEGIAVQRRNKPAILSDQQLELLKEKFQPGKNEYEPFIRRKQLMELLRSRIDTQVASELREEYLEAVELLEQEQRKPFPRKVIFEALSVFLAQQESLARPVNELKELLQTSKF